MKRSFPLPNVSDVLFNQARCTQVSQSSGIGNFGRICPSSQESMNTVFLNTFYLVHHYLHYHHHFNFIAQSLYWIHPRNLWLMLSLAVCPLIQMALTTGKQGKLGIAGWRDFEDLLPCQATSVLQCRCGLDDLLLAVHWWSLATDAGVVWIEDIKVLGDGRRRWSPRSST